MPTSNKKTPEPEELIDAINSALYAMSLGRVHTGTQILKHAVGKKTAQGFDPDLKRGPKQ